MEPTRYLAIVFATMILASAACGDDTESNGESNASTNVATNANAGANSGNGMTNDPAWTLTSTPRDGAEEIPEYAGGAVSVTPSGSPDAPAQLTLTNAVPLLTINFFVDTADGSLPTGTFDVSRFQISLDGLRCSDVKAGPDPQLELVVTETEPVAGSFSGIMQCGTDADAVYYDIEGTFQD
jgi:hypothetical protein